MKSQEVICILFNNPKCDQLTRIKNANLHEHKIHYTWTPTKPISKVIQIGSIFSFHYNKNKISNLIGCNMYCTSITRLTLNYLTFDPTNIYKHGLTYITFFMLKKGNFKHFSTFANDFFSNWSKCCHEDTLISNQGMMGCTCPQITYVS